MTTAQTTKGLTVGEATITQATRNPKHTRNPGTRYEEIQAGQLLADAIQIALLPCPACSLPICTK